MKNEYSAVRTVEGVPVSDSHRNEFPGQRRSLLYAPLTSDRILIPTAGNALQAVSREVLAQQNLLAVAVPEGAAEEILVQAPDGRLLRALIPPQAHAGQTFFVHAPPVADTGIPLHPSAVMGAPRPYPTGVHGLALTPVPPPAPYDTSRPSPPTAPSYQAPSYQAPSYQAPVPSAHDPNLILVQVPPGASPGSVIRVPGPHGRTLEATIPADPTIQEFYLRVPPQKQNWHDSSLAVAPMTLAPFFG
jgi:hypothetical protein